MEEMFMCFDSFNFPGYEVSNLGRVRRVEDGAILEGNSNTRKSDGATSYSVNIKDRYGRVCTKSVARLVAQLFLQFDPKSKHRIYHKDGNCCNNNVNNLFFKGCNDKFSSIRRERRGYESIETIHPHSVFIDTDKEEPTLLKLIDIDSGTDDTKDIKVEAAPATTPAPAPAPEVAPMPKKSSLMFSINHDGKKFELSIEFEKIDEGIEAALATLATAENFYKKE